MSVWEIIFSVCAFAVSTFFAYTVIKLILEDINRFD